MGCVSYSQRFFPDGKISKSALRQADLAARAEVQAIAGEFSAGTLAAGRRLFRHRQGAGRDSANERLQRQRHHPGRTGKIARRHAQGRRLQQAAAGRPAPGPGAGSGRRLRHHGGDFCRTGYRQHGRGRHAPCGKACCTTCWAASTATTCAKPRCGNSCAAITSIRCRPGMSGSSASTCCASWQAH